jgi:hypothetical protein
MMRIRRSNVPWGNAGKMNFNAEKSKLELLIIFSLASFDLYHPTLLLPPLSPSISLYVG